MKALLTKAKARTKKKKVTSAVTGGRNADGKYDWQVLLTVINPIKGDFGSGRPRRLSLHTIAAVCGRDAATILEEMRTSGEVVGYVCPDVQTPIFYLKANSKLPNMIDTRNDGVWAAAAQKIVSHPPEKVKGFKRFGTGDVGLGSGMSYPFEESDKPYAAEIKKVMTAAGFEPQHV